MVYKRSLNFEGKSKSDNKVYELKLVLLKEVIPQETKYEVKPRCIEIALEKVKEGPYWERLLEEKTKQHWLKIDFQKWKDEDEGDDDDDSGGTDSLDDSLKKMDGLGKMAGKYFGTKTEEAEGVKFRELERLGVYGRDLEETETRRRG